jgi:hypothetical protein
MMEGMAMSANIIFISSPGDLLGPILTLVIIWIAYSQYKINRDKLRLDLFNRRYSVYIKLVGCLNRILINHKAEDQDVYNIVSIKEEAFFLFDNSIYSFLDECDKKLSNLNLYEKMPMVSTYPSIKPPNADPLFSSKEYLKYQEATSTYEWIRNKLDELKTIFNPYLYHKKYVMSQLGKSTNSHQTK